jgi:hypothetical protein
MPSELELHAKGILEVASLYFIPVVSVKVNFKRQLSIHCP